MPTGILIVDKPQDWTSHDVVAKLRGVYREKRIGHAGTLDPMATGVLPVFLGRATRVVEFAIEGEKEYLAGLTLGITTDTQDTTGNVLKERPVTVSQADLEGILSQFTGDITQIPPMYSAIKIKGKKLYELARKGQEVERPPRPITISRLELLPRVGEVYPLRVTCSKGTYVRTLCHDIGEVLGCGGVMSSLQRVKAVGFTIEQSHSLESIIQSKDPNSLLLPTDSFFPQPQLKLEDWQVEKTRNGTPFLAEGVANGTYRTYAQDGTFLALCTVDACRVTTVKSFFEV
ncbi:MAG: tRNA pseudouridine(55) synthase TruB [Eubacteriales bacterium]